jgi:hypothetical protein
MALLRSAVRTRYAPIKKDCMNRILITSFKFLLFFIGLIVVERFCHKQTGGFQITKILSNHRFNQHWEIPSLSKQEQVELDLLLDQPYHFFSYGGQSYVFLSEDGKTILKFFKHHHMHTPHWLKKMPLPKFLSHLRSQFIKARKEKLPLFFGSCKIAYTDFKDRTGLIYLHLNKTFHLKNRLTLIDQLNIAHQIDPNTIDFALQRKVELTHKHFRRLRKERRLEEAKKSLDSLLELIVQRCQKGIADRDPNIRRNCGFIGNCAVEVDLGSYTHDETLKIPYVTKQELYYQTRKFERWINKRFPEISSHFQERLSALLEE